MSQCQGQSNKSRLPYLVIFLSSLFLTKVLVYDSACSFWQWQVICCCNVTLSGLIIYGTATLVALVCVVAGMVSLLLLLVEAWLPGSGSLLFVCMAFNLHAPCLRCMRAALPLLQAPEKFHRAWEYYREYSLRSSMGTLPLNTSSLTGCKLQK